MSRTDVAVLAIYYVALALLAVYGLHRLYLVRLRRRFRGAGETAPAAPARWPSITVQLPLFNEPNVAERLIDAVAALDYPGRLDIQVLDDSTDATPGIVARCVSRHRARGVAIEQIRRGRRDGFKAGALAHGMALSASELFAVFDADFVPQPDTLLRMIPRFADSRVGMVQARWGHINREQSLLTRVQAIYLDSHFAIESAARHLGGRFFNFNGTAGIWRREAIEEAGGWSPATLTEDLDLSYRAQLAGWKFVFLPDIEIAAELPSSFSGFQQQQHRWAKGSIQTARRILPRMARAPLPASTKIEAWFHLTNNSAYLLTSIVALLVVPTIVLRQNLGMTWMYLIDAVLLAMSTGSVLFFYVEGQRCIGRDAPPARDLAAVLPVGIAISLRNTAAVLEGLCFRGGEFRRTPKEGSARVAVRERGRAPVGEIVLAVFLLASMVVLASAGHWLAIPLLGLFLSGYGLAAVQGVRELTAEL